MFNFFLYKIFITTWTKSTLGISGNDVYIVGQARIGVSSTGERILKNGEIMELVSF